MSFSVDEQWIRDYCKRTGTSLPKELGEGAGPKRRSKYGAKRTTVDGTTYDSKHEADIASVLKLEVKAMLLPAVMEQVPFLLPGGIRYVADFVILRPDGKYEVQDAKGVRTDVYKIKRKLMQEQWGIEIVEV